MSNMAKNPIGGVGVETQLLNNRVITGMMVGAPSTASTQATGTGASDFNVNIAAGILAVDGHPIEFAAQADFDLASAGAALMASGQSILVDIVAYRSVADGVIRLRGIRGAAATTGSQVAPTDAEIDAKIEAPWWRLARVTVNRTGDTTVTQSYSNVVRPACIVLTNHRGS